MVMDATLSQPPSPQSVGREFVRQYYTLLNKAPNHLHRFYNNHSSFIHDESTLVVGQKNIHSRIQQLNFHDCHAKISQVDAQATLGNGVVVQVTGELSNDGQPMRRFTQTFVLAAQSPKKYYVHNDIFRYQDVYSEEENDIDARIEGEEERKQCAIQAGQVVAAVATTNKEQQLIQVAIEQQQLPTPILDDGVGTSNIITQQQSQPVYYSMSADGARPITVLPVPTVAGPIPLGTNFANLTSTVSTQQHQTVQANGVATHDELTSCVMPQRKTIQTQSSLSNSAQSSAASQGITASIASDEAGCTQTSVGTISNNASQVFSHTSTATIGNYQQQPQQQQQQQQASLHLQSHNVQQQIQVQPHPHVQPQSTPSQSQGMPNVVSQQNILYHQQLPIMEANNRSLVEVDDVAATNNVTVQIEQSSIQINNAVPGRGASSPSDSIQAAPLNENFKTAREQKQIDKYNTAKQQQQQPQNEPKTYANLFKSSSSPNSFVNAALQQQQQQTQHPSNKNSLQATSTISSTTFTQSPNVNSSVSTTTYGARNNSNNNSINNSTNTNENSTHRQDNSQCYQAPLPQRPSSKTFNRDFDQRRTSNSQFGDNQQLFLGNIPHHASEDDLKTLFGRFGTVLDLKIFSKTSGKPPTGMRNPLNYGFITYEDAESVQNCLAHCPLYFPENSPERQKLNVEEKKPRSRANDLQTRQGMSGCGNTGSGGINNNVNNNQRNMNNNGPPPSRSLSNSGGGGGSGSGSNIIRGSGTNNNMSRGGSSGPRMGNTFNRNDNRSSNSGSASGGNASHMRGCNNNVQATNNNYSVRR